MAPERHPHTCQGTEEPPPCGWRGGREAAGFPSPQLFPWLTQCTTLFFTFLLGLLFLSGERFTFGLSCRPEDSLDGVCMRKLFYVHPSHSFHICRQILRGDCSDARKVKPSGTRSRARPADGHCLVALPRMICG